MDTFARYPVYRLTLSRPKEIPEGYPCELVTIGDHIRKKRLDLGMTQIEAGEQMNVTESTVWNWEHGTEPEIRYIPAIIEFLGYVPFECPNEPLERLRYYKRINGLSYRRLGVVMGRAPEQLADWLSNGVRPCGKNILKIVGFLSGIM